ncbi:MFS transporter [Humisphaera borealis]|uniref:MFS transporter n=1 Tax=Humisphaera borealis TaxID=2807512 RepID=A0A7M2X2K2_9BACT|nr:MFS transporter [Humisphaera borealis]QOV91839.1 MFS transporter [Humisphaera borealis]
MSQTEPSSVTEAALKPIEHAPPATSSKGAMMVLLAAFLGWMFDGLEMGIYPQVARPSLRDLLPGAAEGDIGFWHNVVDALFLSGAALGGLVFGYLGDKIGRVRAMSLSILVYSLFTGFCYFAQAPWQMGALRFIAAIGMGGEWSLGVALVMEVWPAKHRPLLAGVIGAASNVGFLLISFICFVFPVSENNWRFIMLAGAAPALLTFFVRLFVPESEKWQESQKHGPTAPLKEAFTGKTARSMWLAIVFASVALLGTWGAVQKIPAWVDNLPAEHSVRIGVEGKADASGLLVTKVSPKSLAESAGITAGTIVQSVEGQAIKTEMAIYEAIQAKQKKLGDTITAQVSQDGIVRTVSLTIDKWSSNPRAKAVCGMLMAVGAIIGCLIAPLIGAKLGRRPAYFLLCLASLVVCAFMFRAFDRYDGAFMAMAFLAGGTSAAFYGWLPLYLPELFPTRVRATAQGIAFNFGRIFAAAGALMGGQLMLLWGDYAKMGAAISLIYVVGMVVIWFAPETRGKPLPE